MRDKAEHRVECHRLAEELRAKGKDTWTYRVNINEYRPKDDTEEAAIEAGKRIAAALRTRLPRDWRDEDHEDYDEEHHDLVWELENISAGDGCSAKTHLNAVVEALYDWADLKRVWLK